MKAFCRRLHPHQVRQTKAKLMSKTHRSQTLLSTWPRQGPQLTRRPDRVKTRRILQDQRRLLSPEMLPASGKHQDRQVCRTRIEQPGSQPVVRRGIPSLVQPRSHLYGLQLLWMSMVIRTHRDQLLFVVELRLRHRLARRRGKRRP